MGMAKYHSAEMIEMLELALKNIKYYHQQYEKKMFPPLKDCKIVNKKLDYHIFSFSQILFAIRDCLIKEHPVKETRINDFFERGRQRTISTTSAGKVAKIANDWKHDGGLDLRQHFYDLKIFGIKKIKMKDSGMPQEHMLYPEQEIEQYQVAASKVKKLTGKDCFYPNLPVNDLFEESLAEVKEFVKKLNEAKD